MHGLTGQLVSAYCRQRGSIADELSPRIKRHTYQPGAEILNANNLSVILSPQIT